MSEITLRDYQLDAKNRKLNNGGVMDNIERTKDMDLAELRTVTVALLNRLDKIAEYSQPTPFINFLGFKFGKPEFWNMEQELTYLLATAKLKSEAV